MEPTNPYQTPNEELVPESEQQIADHIDFFSTKSRIGRLRYLAYSVGMSMLVNLLLSVALGVLAGLSGNQEIFLLSVVVTSIVAIAVMVIVTVRRLHDLDTSGWAALLIIIPLVNFFFAMYLLFARGTQGANRFGLQPPANSTGVIITAWIMPLIAVLGILAAVAIPAYQDYTERAQNYEQQQSQP